MTAADPVQPERPRRATHTITELQQVKVLATPLRLKILEVLCQEERTTKQVAGILGEKPTKLYHHVEALEKVGLIELRRTRQNRGTLEKYYLAIARGFLTDSRLFSADRSPTGETEGWQDIAATLLESSAIELRNLARSSVDICDNEAEAIIVQLQIVARESRIAELQEKLLGLLKEIQELDDEDEEGDVAYRMTLAFYPLEVSNAGDDREGPVDEHGDDHADPDPARQSPDPG